MGVDTLGPVVRGCLKATVHNATQEGLVGSSENERISVADITSSQNTTVNCVMQRWFNFKKIPVFALWGSLKP